jgi:tRNA dimethylallyltransferase
VNYPILKVLEVSKKHSAPLIVNNKFVSKLQTVHQPLLVILGPTACGKTHLATHLAYQIGGEIISADSRQVYRDMDIGTGKDLNEYIVNNQPIPYHLINITEAGDAYHVHRFQQDFQQAITEISACQKTPILCGGTGLYIEAVLKEHQFTAIPIDDNTREQLAQLSNEELLTKFHATPSPYTPLADTSTRKRLIRAIEIGIFLQSHPLSVVRYPSINYQIFGLNLPVEERRTRITRRLHERLNNGMIEEVQGLLNRGIAPEKLIYYGLEYKFITEYLLGKLDYSSMVERLNVAIHQFAKRQMTYFRKMERDSLHIHWLDALLPTDQLIAQILETKTLR